jgi:hypothetical protein
MHTSVTPIVRQVIARDKISGQESFFIFTLEKIQQLEHEYDWSAEYTIVGFTLEPLKIRGGDAVKVINTGFEFMKLDFEALQVEYDFMYVHNRVLMSTF